MNHRESETIVSSAVISNEFLEHAKKTFLNESQVEKFLAFCRQPLRKSIRVNTLKISVLEFKAIARQWGLELTAIPWCAEGFWVKFETSGSETSDFKTPDSKAPDSEAIDSASVDSGPLSLGNFPEHLQGLFYIQEASSMLPPLALLHSLKSAQSDPPHCPLVLDLAAAPGSKTTQLAAMLANRGLVLANEMSASRVKVLHSNLVRCGVTNTCMSQFDGRKLGKRLSSLFDYVLLDAPCGGEGTVRKDHMALKDWQLSNLQSIAKLQKELILIAYQCLKPGGRLVYSTCTLSPEENHQVAEYLLEQTDAKISRLNELFVGADKAVTEQGFLHVLPQIYDSEGFFVAAFTKPADATTEFCSKMESPPFKPLDKKTGQQVQTYYQSHFGFNLAQTDYLIQQRDKEIWLFPKNFPLVSDVVRLNRSGIKLAEIYPNKIRSTHEFACGFSKLTDRQVLEIDRPMAQEFYKGRNLEIDAHSLDDGEVIISYNNHAIGIGRLAKNKVKNQLPRDLVKDQIQF